MSARTKASDLFVRALEREGVQFVFGVPGEENLDFLESLRTSAISFVVTRHEQSAGFMAATVGRMTGHAGVALSTLGPGATNLVTAAAYANLGGMPAVFITGQKPVQSSKQGMFQMIDTVDLMRPVTKSTKQVTTASAIPALVRDAFRVAEEERPGVAHLELPEDIASDDTDAVPITPSNARRPVADDKAVAQAVARIEAAAHPLILVGAAANRKQVAKMLEQFMGKTGIPAFSTQLGKGVVDERNPLFVGVATISKGDFVHRAVDAADLIINLGHDIVEKPPFILSPGGPDIIHINFTSAQVDQVYHPQLEVVGDIANALWQIGERLAPRTWDSSRFRAIRAATEAFDAERAGDNRYPLVPQRIVTAVRSAVPQDGILALDNGMYKLWFARNYRTYFPNTFLVDNALASMGAGLPSAIAAKLVSPDRSVVAVVGDGGFMMNSQELETAMRLGLDLTIVLLTDGAYGMIRWKQESMGFQKFGLAYGNPNFVAYAESYGARGLRARSAEELDTLLAGAVAGSGVTLIEVPIDYSASTQVFSEELPRRAAEI